MDSRRVFLIKLATFPLLLSSSKAFACDVAKVTSSKVKNKIFNASSSTAKRLNFVRVAKQAKNSKYKEGQECGKCKYFNLRTKEGDFAKCAFAQNRYVPRCGWCKQFKMDPKKS